MLPLLLRVQKPPFVATSTPARPVRNVPRRSSSLNEFVIQQSYIIGKGLTLFVLFTASLNWMYYRGLREYKEEQENMTDKDKDKDKKENGRDL